MVNYNNDNAYLYIVNNIIENNDFKQIENIKHHDTNRLNHSLKVSYYSYRVAKYLKLDYKDVARAGLLHDFYIDSISECSNPIDKILLFSTKHPKDALNNSLKYFELSEKEKNIIESHMFPVNYKVPKYAESWIVSIVDKILSIGEFSKKFHYKFGIYVLFIINVVK